MGSILNLETDEPEHSIGIVRICRARIARFQGYPRFLDLDEVLLGRLLGWKADLASWNIEDQRDNGQVSDSKPVLEGVSQGTIQVAAHAPGFLIVFQTRVGGAVLL